MLAFHGAPTLGDGGMVDTVQFGNIYVGMPEREVIARLGPPDRVQSVERRPIRGGSTRKIKGKRLVYEGVNPASGQRIITTILIEKGKVVDKRRSYK